MHRHLTGCLILSIYVPVCLAQTGPGPASESVKTQAQAAQPQGATASPIDPNAPHMSRQTRLQIIRDFETQVVYARTIFPMGTKGLKLENGVITPSGEDLQQAIAIYGPAIKPGDPAQITYVQIKPDHIHLELNGGAIRRQKWYQHIEIAGSTGGVITPGGGQPINNPHGSCIDVYFNKYVPEMSAQQFRDLLFPLLDFKARSKEQAYLNTVPQNVKQAILEHRVLVGMNQEMVLYAMGRPPKKDREKDSKGAEYEEWIYGQPPQDVDFVRFVGDEVVRLEIMKVGGEKIVRTQKEVFLETTQEKEAKAEQQERPANAPSLRRPGEDSQDVPKSTEGGNPAPVMPPPDLPPTNAPPVGPPGPIL